MMRNWTEAVLRRLILLVVTLSGAVAAAADEEQGAEPVGGKVLVARVDDGVLTDARKVKALVAAVERARESAAAAFVVSVKGSAAHGVPVFESILESLPGDGVRTVAVVEGAASGAAAALALCCDEVYMAEGAVLGAALPENETGDVAERQLSVVRAQLRSIAVRKGRDAELVGAMVDPSVVLKDGETEVKAEGGLLTLTASEAVEGFAGRSAVADGIADLEAVLGKTGGETVELGDDFEVVASATVESPETEGVAEPGTGDAADAGEDEMLDFVRTDEESYEGKVVVVEVGEDDLVAMARFDFMRRTLKRAEVEGAKGVIFDMNTPGGYAWETAELMINDLSQSKVPTVAYVNPSAISAGCLIAVSTDKIYMAPVSTIGSAGVITGTGQDLEPTMRQKIYSMMISVARAVADKKGHNPDVVEAFIDEEKEVVIDGVVVSPAGKMLNLDQDRATEVLGGRPVLAEGIAADLDEVVEAAGFGDAEVVVAQPLGMEAFALWVQRITVLLILLGVAGAYMEMQTPGFGIPGLVSVLAFGLFFFGNNVAGKLAGYELAVVFALGVILVLVEFILLPGTVFPALVGGLLIAGSLLFAMVDQMDFELIKEGSETGRGLAAALRQPVVNLSLGLGGGVVLIMLAMLYLPKTRAMDRLVLSDSIEGTSAGEAPADETVSTGDEGTAVTDLRPWGRGNFSGTVVEVSSGREFVDAGASIRVVSTGGGEIRVEELS